jgi:arabinogalactan oligomer / maltooligosaccharide transport system permease protein
MHRWWFAYAMLTPVTVVMAVLIFYPLVRGILYSFTNADRTNFTGQGRFDPVANKFVGGGYEYIGFDNYIDILRSGEFRQVLVWTALWTFVNVFFHFTLGLGLAVALNRTLRARGLYRMLLMVPWAVPSFISAYAFRFIFNDPYGFVSQTLTSVGINNPPAWLSDPFWAKVAVIVTNVWLGVPFMMVALLGGLQAIDADLLDAAAVDGASAWRRFWDITMPGLRPVAATVILLGIIWTFNMFNVIYLVSAGNPGGATEILITQSYKLAFEQYRYGYAAAYSAIIFLILLAYGTWQNRVTRATEAI